MILVWTVLISIFMFVLPRISIRFAAPGSFALAVSFPIVLGLYSFYGSGLHISSSIGVLIAGIIFTLTISTILSIRPEMAIKHLIIYSAAVFIGMAFANYDIWLIIIYSAIIHSVFICVPLKREGNGLLGCSNFSGAFLAPCIFIAFYIDQNAVALLLTFVLFRTRCRGAILGVIISSFFINQTILIALLIILGSLVSINRSKLHGTLPHKTLMCRYNRWKVVLFKFITLKRFFFGVGGDVGRLIFMKETAKNYSRARRLHSDIIQGVFDGGIFYVILYLWIGIYSITIAPPALAAALLSLMIAGLFVDTQLVHFTSVLFWLLIGQINYSATPFVTLTPWMISIAIIIFAIAIQTWGRAFVADTILGIGISRKDPRLVAIAHKINPDDSFATANIVRLMITMKQYGPAFDRAWKMVDRYDAELTPEIPYYILAVTAFNVGAIPIAKVMAERALMYRKKHDGARKLLERIEKERGK